MAECDTPVQISGKGEIRRSMKKSAKAAKNAAKAAVPSAALTKATLKALKEEPCLKKNCRHLRISSLTWTITSVTASRGGLFHLIASLFTLSWKWEGIAKFTYSAKRHCHNKPLRRELISYLKGEEDEELSVA